VPRSWASRPAALCELPHRGGPQTPEGWRYTAWAKWNQTSLHADWDNIAGRELYDLRSDPGTTFDFPGYADSLALNPSYKSLIDTLHADLRAAFESFE